MRIITGTLFAILLTATGLTSTAFAQLSVPVEYDVAPTSSVGSGCIGPSPCLCPAVITLSSARGRLVLTPLLPPLGPLFEYTISGDLSLGLSTDDVDFTVTGNYTFDAISVLHEGSLTLANPTFFGPTFYETNGFGGVADQFPDSFQFTVFAPLDACTYSGLYLTLNRSPEFIRGDVNGDDAINIADPIALLQTLFAGGTPACARAGDFDDDGQLELSDAIDLLGYLFTTSASPAAPFPDCGQDPTVDGIPCEGSTNACP